MIGDCKVPGATESRQVKPTVFIHRENREDTADGVPYWTCTVCGASLPRVSDQTQSHLQMHILKLQSELFLSRKALEGQVGELMRAVKENLERALDAEVEVDELRATIADLGGL